MLVLTRSVSESIIINNDIEVTVLGVKRGQVKLGIAAPRDVSVNRKEVQQRIETGVKREQV